MIKNNQYVVDRLYDGVAASTTGDTTTGDATVINYSTSGLSQADALKLASIQTGAEVNQLAFSYIKVDSIVNPIAAILKTDTLNVIGTSPILITIDIAKNLVFSFDTSIIPDITEVNDHITDTNVHFIGTEKTDFTNHLANTAIHHTHNNKTNVLDLLTEENVTVLSHLSIIDNKLQINVDTYSTGELSAYGLGSGGSGTAIDLDSLVDVNITNPLINNVLVYNGTFWVNVPSTDIQTDLTGYATEIYVNNKIGVVNNTISDLNSLIATKWTQDNTKITSWDQAAINAVHSNRVQLDTFNANDVSVLDHLFYDSINARLYTDIDFYSEKEVSAYGIGISGGGSGATDLNALTDVVISNPITNNVLLYDGTFWINTPSSTLQTDLMGYATEIYVNTKINDLINGAPSAFDTLKEIADVLQGNVNSIGDIITTLGTKWTQDNTKITNWDTAYTNSHSHVNMNALNLLSVVDGKLRINGDMYATGEVSAYGVGSGGSGSATNLDALTDVVLIEPVAGNLLQYDGTFWENVPASNVQIDLTGYATESYVNAQVTNKTNWDTAYSWGNHATAGYLTALNENDPLFTASPAASINSNDILLLNHLEYDATNSTSILKGDLPNFSIPLGPELLTVNNWTSVGWTGNFTSNFIHTTGNTNPLSNSIAAISGNRYVIDISTLDGGDGSITVSFGGTSRVVSGDDSVTIGVFATNANNFIITPTTDFIGTIYNISIKLVTGIIPALTTCKTNANVIINETRYSLSGNLYTGSNSGQYSIGTMNTGIGSKALYSVIDGDYNTAVGTNSLFYTVNGNTNVGVGTFAGINNTSGTNNIFFGYSSGTKIDSGQPLKNPTDSIFIGNSTRALVDDGVNEIVIGTSVVGLGSNTISIGTPNTTLTRVYGNLYATGEVTAYQTSDVRLKENITNVNNSLKILDTLRPVTYNWNDVAKQINPTKTDDEDVGLIAQELEEVLPNLVHTMDNGYKSIDYIKLIPYLIGAIKELKKEINLLNNID